MTKPKKNRYDSHVERLTEKAARGEYELIEPLDILIIEQLPLEGTLFGGLYPLGETVENLRKKFDGKVKVTTLTARMRLLNIQGLVARTNSVSEGRGMTVWQRTAAGTKLLNDRKEKKG